MSKRPDPIEKRIAKGNTSGRPLPEHPPERAAGAPQPPEWLAGPALDAWHRFSVLLEQRGQLSQCSMPSLTALCIAWAEWAELAQELQRKGRTQRVRTKVGKPGERGAYMERLRPAAAAFADADRRLRAWLVEFGLTDASRGKVETMPPPPTGLDAEGLGRYGLQ